MPTDAHRDVSLACAQDPACDESRKRAKRIVRELRSEMELAAVTQFHLVDEYGDSVDHLNPRIQQGAKQMAETLALADVMIDACHCSLSSIADDVGRAGQPLLPQVVEVLAAHQAICAPLAGCSDGCGVR